MKLFYPAQRTTLLIPGTGPERNPDQAHLHIVLNDPCDQKKNLLVNISGYHDRCDKTCVIEDGNDFVKKKSFVFYARAAIVDTSQLIECVKSEIIFYRGLMDEAVFKRIMEGTPNSPHTTPSIKKYFDDNCV